MNPALSRSVVYPLIFALRGEEVRRQTAELSVGQWRSSAEVRQLQLQSVQRLVGGVLATDSPLARKLRSHGVETFAPRDPDDMARLPITEKSDLREHVAWLRSRGARLGPHDVRLTGGSTGEPCLVLADRAASSRSLAARAVCQGWFGVDTGDRQIRCWGRSVGGHGLRDRLKDTLLNRVRLDSLACEKTGIERTLRRVERFGADFIYGYTSLIQMLADSTDSADIARCFGQLKVVVATSETILPSQQRKLAAHFGSPVALEYGCSEVDIISFSCPHGQQHVVADNVLTEVVRLGDEPEGFGQVLVTDLNNHLMPILRYRLGDLVPLAAPVCDCGRGWNCLGPVVGRSQGQYIQVPGKGRVHSQSVVYVVEALMAEGLVAGRFRIVQERSDLMRVLFSRTADEMPSTAALADRFRHDCLAVLGPDMSWEVEFVEPAVLSAGTANKFRHFLGLSDS